MWPGKAPPLTALQRFAQLSFSLRTLGPRSALCSVRWGRHIAPPCICAHTQVHTHASVHTQIHVQQVHTHPCTHSAMHTHTHRFGELRVPVWEVSISFLPGMWPSAPHNASCSLICLTWGTPDSAQGFWLCIQGSQ